eukprot:scaffold86967_cov45-Phaeocystis_antarctica.AAC.2
MDDDDGGGGTHPPPPPYADTWEAMENPDRGRPGANGKPKVPSHMLRLQVMMRAYRRGRTFGVLENKLLSHTAVSRLGLPAVLALALALAVARGTNPHASPSPHPSPNHNPGPNPNPNPHPSLGPGPSPNPYPNPNPNPNPDPDPNPNPAQVPVLYGAFAFARLGEWPKYAREEMYAALSRRALG